MAYYFPLQQTERPEGIRRHGRNFFGVAQKKANDWFRRDSCTSERGLEALDILLNVTMNRENMWKTLNRCGGDHLVFFIVEAIPISTN